MGLESSFRRYTDARQASPKLWADAWLLAFAEMSDGTIVTFDRAVAHRSPRGILLQTTAESRNE
jgi:predicted nucleic acid-binding protein